MDIDNKTILANLATIIGEKEEEIKQLKQESQLVTLQCQAVSGPNGAYRIKVDEPPVNVGKTYEQLEAELLAAKDEIEQLKETDVWYHRTQAANRRRKKAERTIKKIVLTLKRLTNSIDDRNNDVYQLIEIIESQMRELENAKSEIARYERKLDSITDNIDKFMQERLTLTQDRNALLIVSLNTQLKDKKKLIEEKDKLIAQLTQQLADLNAQQDNH